mmetsp:Transcript_84681/g.238236  ORF Transcript_84681/g.238236 Transcript_84681/m.238236 type:complete len:209 (+) Transcript_84681:943-1569(+)
MPQEDGEHGFNIRGVRGQPVHEVKVRACGQTGEAKTEDAVEGELDEWELRLLRDAQEIGLGAHLRLGHAVAETDAIANVLSGQLPRAVRDARRVTVRLPGRQHRVVFICQLHAGRRGLAPVATVPRTDLLRALHGGQHDVARARVEDDVEELWRLADRDLAIVLSHVQRSPHPVRRRRRVAGERHWHCDEGDVLLQRHCEGLLLLCRS